MNVRRFGAIGVSLIAIVVATFFMLAGARADTGMGGDGGMGGGGGGDHGGGGYTNNGGNTNSCSCVNGVCSGNACPRSTPPPPNRVPPPPPARKVAPPPPAGNFAPAGTATTVLYNPTAVLSADPPAVGVGVVTNGPVVAPADSGNSNGWSVGAGVLALGGAAGVVATVFRPRRSFLP